MSVVDQQRVAGWLTLALQRECRVLAGVPLTYDVSDSGVVTLEWRGGPLASDVAASLLRAADPDMMVVQLGASELRADLLVDRVSVVLLAYGPDPTRPPDPIRVKKVWTWPDPLNHDGAARDSVWWHVAPDPGGVGEAVVVRLPTEVIHPQPAEEWTEPSHLVVHTEHVVSTSIVSHRTNAWEDANEHAAIRLRWARPEWTIDDADRWLEAEFTNAHRPRPQVTAVLMRDRCLARVRIGLRVEVLVQDSPGWVPWSVVPSVIHSSLCRPDPRKQPPSVLVVREFGIGYACRFQINTTISVPFLDHG